MNDHLLAVDTDVLVHWSIEGTRHHAGSRRLIEQHTKHDGGSIVLVPQVMHEFLHIVTDARRFERPMTVTEALAWCRDLWEAPEVVRTASTPTTFRRTCSLMERHGLGRKRILDTALAATLEAFAVRRLATLNGRDFRLFSFLEIVSPTA